MNDTVFPITLKISVIGFKESWEDIERVLDMKIEMNSGEVKTINKWEHYTLRDLNVDATIHLKKAKKNQPQQDVQIKKSYKEVYDRYRFKQQQDKFYIDAHDVDYDNEPICVPMP